MAKGIAEIIEDFKVLHPRAYERIKAEGIDECKQILLDAMARDGKTKCHEYMVAVNEMEQLKEKK